MSILASGSAMAERASGLVLKISPQEAEGIPGGGSSFTVQVGTTLGAARLTVKTGEGLQSYLGQSQFAGGGETQLVLVPLKGTEGKTLAATVTAKAGSVSVKKVVKLKAMKSDAVQGMKATAVKWRDAALEVLRKRHPDFAASNGLSSENIPWKGYAPYPLFLVVSHYHFRWGEWTAKVMWHVTIPPHNWKRIYFSNEKEGKYWAVQFDTHDKPTEIPTE